jgi:hypothetical protein
MLAIVFFSYFHETQCIFLSTSYTISFTISLFSEKQQAKMKKNEEPTQKKMRNWKKPPT